MNDWRFLLDENVDPKTVDYLRKEDVHAEHVVDALREGADDEDDIVPYAATSDLVVVTSDVTDFSTIGSDDGPGVVLLYDDTMPAYEIAGGILAMIDAYPDRDAFRGREELDVWTDR